MIYFDNAATSFPKPPAVATAMADFLITSAGNPGRSGHALALAAQRVVSDTRRVLASFFGVTDPSRLVFTLNGTDALNMALWGVLRPGDRVVTTSLEHHGVARPLRELEERGVAVVRVRCATDGSLDLNDLASALAAGPVRLVAMIHASNVTGTILPAAAAARLAHQHGALFLLDAAQTAGVLPIDVEKMGIDLLAFPGHKGLLGPTGTGGLYISPGVNIWPMRQGGTGTHSEMERQPVDLPEWLEAGTVNTVGIAGLRAALDYLNDRGREAIRAHEITLTARLLDGLRQLPDVQIHGPADAQQQVSTVSITLDGWEPLDLAAVLDATFGIAVRPGLHCAPWAHHTIGTYPQGTVRLSPGCFNTEQEVDQVLAALHTLSQGTLPSLL